MKYKVTLTDKVKLEVEAETPQAALEQAREEVKGKIFEPDTASVKED